MQSEKKNCMKTEIERSNTLHPDKHALQPPPNIWTPI